MSNANQVLPSASVSELSPGAAFAPAGNDDIVVFMGPSSRGPLNSPRLIAAQDKATLTSTFGTGRAVKAMARFLDKIGQPAVFERLTTASVAGVLGSVTVTRTSSGSAPTNTIAGTPTDGGDIVISYVLGGVTGTGPIDYQVSTDGGNTFGATQHLLTGTSITVLGVTLTLGSSKTITTGDTTAWLQTMASSSVRPQTFTGTGTSAITVSGTPYDRYEVAFQVLVGGTIGTAGIMFRYTMDAGAPQPVWTSAIALNTATSYLLLDGPLSSESSGLTLNFGAGTLVALDQVTFGTTEPAYDSSGITAGIGTQSPAAGLLGWNGTWNWIRAVGPVTASLAGTVDSLVSGMDAINHPSWAVCDYRDRAGNETNAQHSLRFQADFLNYTSTHVGVAFGLTRYTDTINGRNNRGSAMDVLVPRAQAYTLDTNWAEYDLNALPADVSIFDANNNVVEHNANTDNGPNSMGAITLRTWPGQAGVYPTQAALMGPDTDIKLIPLRRVMNAAKVVQFEIEQLEILKDPPTYKTGDQRGTPGNLVESYARKVERIARSMITSAIGAMVSGFTFTVNRTPLSLGGGNFKVTFAFKINPRIYITQAQGTAQFTNPALDVINAPA